MDEQPKDLVPREERERAVARLVELGNGKCPWCGHNDWKLLDGYASVALSARPGDILGSKSVPCAVLACLTCGYLSMHSLGILNLLPPPESDGGGAK